MTMRNLLLVCCLTGWTLGCATIAQNDLASLNPIDDPIAEVELDLIFDPLFVPAGIEERDQITYERSPFNWGVAPLGPMEAEACSYACTLLNGKVILPFEMQVASRAVQRHLIRSGYRSDAVWVETGRGYEPRPLPFDPEAAPIKLKRTAFQPMCLCSGAVMVN